MPARATCPRSKSLSLALLLAACGALAPGLSAPARADAKDAAKAAPVEKIEKTRVVKTRVVRRVVVRKRTVVRAPLPNYASYLPPHVNLVGVDWTRAAAMEAARASVVRVVAVRARY
ncbi:MAG: hypothetical protein JWN93_3782 [Hyphomicrobiales bacterium]|jgi:hypothetical protein|nr:hypothetical protein [Hyphomicrobiales bacterium]